MSAHWLRALALALAAVAVPWSEPASADDLGSFTTSNVSAALQTMGATEITSGSDSDGAFVDYDFVGRKYRAGLHLCTAGSCNGLELICSFHGVVIPLEQLNKFNFDRVFGKAIRTQNDVFRSERYVIADGGISTAKLVAEFQIHAEVTDFLLEQLRGAQLISSVVGPGRTTLGSAAHPQGPTPPQPTQANARVNADAAFTNEIR